MQKTLINRIIIYLLLGFFLLFLMLPFIEMFLVSIKPLEQVFEIPHSLWPETIYLKTYTHDIWETVPLLPLYLQNSILISTVVTLICLVAAIPAGYAFSRFRFPGRNAILFLTLAVNMFSPVVLLVPLFRTMRMFNLLNTYWCMIIPGATFLLPFSIWMLTGYFRNIPKALEQAALVDGATPWQALFHIVMPLAAPGMVTVATYAFVTSWGQQFVFAISFNTIREIQPITQGLYEYFGQNIMQWNELMAASLVAILPVTLVFLFLQKYLIEGLTAGAIKG
ncbi:MAG: carbohydrate ABC transporter permease [Anaerolineaceae bacterium]|nr:carbohydrate ABC transporter permease [Anaerolineaceae bacterium]